MRDALRAFSKLFTPPRNALEKAGALCLPALIGASDAFLAATLSNRNVVLAVCPGIPSADRLTDDLKLITAKSSIRIMEFPPLTCDDKSSLGLRIKTIAALRAWTINPYPLIITTPFPALVTPIQSSPSEAIRIGANRITFTQFREKLHELSYNRTSQVEQEGDYSIRGGIVDVWSPGDELPIRAEFFGEDLESIRTFNAATQLSIERVDSADILSANMEQSVKDTDSYLTTLLPQDGIVLAIDHNSYNIQPFLADSNKVLYTGDPAPRGVPNYAFTTTPLPGFAELGAEEAHHPELFDAAKKRLSLHLAAAEKRGVGIVYADDLSGGFEIGNIIVVSKADRVFTKRKAHSHRSGATNIGQRLDGFNDIEPGEYVVHVDYGIGRYIGTSEILLDGKRNEVFTIEYADGGKLHVPASSAHLLSRYVGIKGESVRLHRLDGKKWSKDKKDAQKAVCDLAAALLETQAKRETIPGFSFKTDCDGIIPFEAAFPYEETPDQTAAITAVKSDMAAQKPMDRLICGDAGYGKTEVAMRAAYIAAMNGKQVAVLAPTTVLAEQHFETFTSRFDGTPIRIESVSRFQSAATHSGTFKRLATGICDIVIGTHALLSSKICFHDLGLIVIDEEQRFGVRQKEFLKKLRSTADILTLSATPIPRTLYLSMTGARDLSLLKSPPKERVAVETKIVRDSDELIKIAVDTELQRGGQVYFLHNRVTSIVKVEKRLKAICPKAKIIIAHGQMDSKTLAQKMHSFERGQFDILLSTSIVESGIDIPRANTILVDQADKFGMAELYQLRGRVGRSATQGYAYFLLPASGDVDSDARERLNAILRNGGLGGGFNLAIRDLELRGAGNLLGAQQSGHIAAIGFGLYCQLLQRTIALMKGHKPKEIVDAKLNLDFTNARLSYEYIEDDIQRMSLMRRFAEAQDEKTIAALAKEMKDRFGPLPNEAREFVQVAKLRIACTQANIVAIDVKEKRAVFYKNGSHAIAFVESLHGVSAEAKLNELIRMTR